MNNHGKRLILGSVTVENAEAGYSDRILTLWFPGMTFAEVSSIVLNSSNTQTIVFEYGEMSDTYEGYTDCIAIRNDDGTITVCLRKGEVNAS